MCRDMPITIEDFTADYGYSTGLINLEHLFTLEQISKSNLREDGGTLGLTFFDMLKALQECGVSPSDIHVYVIGKFFTRTIEDDIEVSEYFEVEEIYGYCLFYRYDVDKAQIAHICIDPNYQRMGFGKMLLEKIKGLYKLFDTSTCSCYNVYSDRKEVAEHI